MDDFIYLGSDGGDISHQRADAVQNRAEILETAHRLFSDEGINNVSMSAIAREAHVGKGTLYRHFRNKADLCMALLDSEQQSLQNRTLVHLQQSKQSPQAQLQWFLQEVCAYTQRNLALLCSSNIGDEDPIHFEHPAHRWQRVTILGLLRRMDITDDVEYIADAIYALVNPNLYRFQHRTQGYEHERIVTGLIDVVGKLIS